MHAGSIVDSRREFWMLRFSYLSNNLQSYIRVEDRPCYSVYQIEGVLNFHLKRPRDIGAFCTSPTPLATRETCRFLRLGHLEGFFRPFPLQPLCPYYVLIMSLLCRWIIHPACCPRRKGTSHFRRRRSPWKDWRFYPLVAKSEPKSP